MRALVTSATIAAVVGICPVASAQSPAAKSAMDDWFDAERNEAFVFLGLGAVSAGTGTYLLTRNEDFAHGAGYAAIGLGALEIVFATTYVLSLSPKNDELTNDLASDPKKFKHDELDRMNGIADRFVMYRYAELGVLATGAGLATYGFTRDKPVIAGIGVVAGVQAIALLTLDLFAERRTHRYIKKLEQFQPESSSGSTLSRGERGWGFHAPIMTGAW